MGAFDIELYTKVVGDQATGASASSSGSLAQQVAYLIANPATMLFKKKWSETASHGFCLAFPIVYGKTHSTSVLNVPNATWTVSGGTHVWDATNKAYYVRNTTGGGFNASYNLANVMGGVIFPYGFGGKQPDWTLDDTVGLLPPQATKLTVEFWAAFPSAAADSTTRGLGMTDSVGSYTSARRCVQIQRVSGAVGWRLSTADASTRSSTDEASDTSDGNPHLFRVEMTDAAVTLYVDGVQKATKSTNHPFNSSTPAGPTFLDISAAAADATDAVRLYAFAAGLS